MVGRVCWHLYDSRRVVAVYYKSINYNITLQLHSICCGFVVRCFYSWQETFQVRAAAAGNALSMTVERRVRRTISDVDIAAHSRRWTMRTDKKLYRRVYRVSHLPLVGLPAFLERFCTSPLHLSPHLKRTSERLFFRVFRDSKMSSQWLVNSDTFIVHRHCITTTC